MTVTLTVTLTVTVTTLTLALSSAADELEVVLRPAIPADVGADPGGNRPGVAGTRCTVLNGRQEVERRAQLERDRAAAAAAAQEAARVAALPVVHRLTPGARYHEDSLTLTPTAPSPNPNPNPDPNPIHLTLPLSPPSHHRYNEDFRATQQEAKRRLESTLLERQELLTLTLTRTLT